MKFPSNIPIRSYKICAICSAECLGTVQRSRRDNKTGICQQSAKLEECYELLCMQQHPVLQFGLALVPNASPLPMSFTS